MAVMFESWGYSKTLLIATGTLEIVGAIFILSKKTKLMGSSLLMFIMFAAAYTHFDNYKSMGFPFLNLALIAILASLLFVEQKPRGSNS